MTDISNSEQQSKPNPVCVHVRCDLPGTNNGYCFRHADPEYGWSPVVEPEQAMKRCAHGNPVGSGCVECREHMQSLQDSEPSKPADLSRRGLVKFVSGLDDETIDRLGGVDPEQATDPFEAKLERQRQGIVDPVRFERGVCDPEGAKLLDGTTFDRLGGVEPERATCPGCNGACTDTDPCEHRRRARSKTTNDDGRPESRPSWDGGANPAQHSDRVSDTPVDSTTNTATLTDVLAFEAGQADDRARIRREVEEAPPLSMYEWRAFVLAIIDGGPTDA